MRNTSHGRKMAAPIVVTLLLVLYYLAFALACWLIPGMPVAFRLILGLLPLIPVGILLYVLIQRIKEIRSGEEDDLSQY
ncbi:MAG: hypothetical protein IKL84_04250 [Clostridia bacterium]|nr:hypothetical protein [Clostridia bacterium]